MESQTFKLYVFISAKPRVKRPMIIMHTDECWEGHIMVNWNLGVCTYNIRFNVFWIFNLDNLDINWAIIRKKFKIITDHVTLKGLMNAKAPKNQFLWKHN
ncbi:hypothetical protein RCL_jg13944.t1 [Rhizophagus clarus]|uniref:Uncharacterized protein n=1 Tax=Rhizophagus clarus TaxID=94130 RepID=A0A8H3LN23_9GLOM|nr:hypothetical protein RCL_jg13944.t1 [Rhizophagus clarus]